MNELAKRSMYMRRNTFASIVLCNFFVIAIHSQILHHQMIASIVSSKVTNNGLSVHQSIGQLSMNGTYSSSSLVVQQGFQQSRKFVKTEPTSLHNLISTTVFPNPFNDYVNFHFSGSVKGKVTLVLYDIFGRFILKQDKLGATHTSVTLQSLSGLPVGQYIVKLMSPDYKFSTKLIKTK